MATNNYNIDAVNVILLEILEDIVVNIMEGTYADETDEYLVGLVTLLLSAIDSGATIASGDDQTPESEPEGQNPILGGADGQEFDEDAEESVSLHSDGLPSGDALSSAAESELAPIPEAAPLGNNNTVQEDDDSKISEAEEDHSVLLASSCTSSCGDAPSSESGPVDPTPTPEGGPLDDVLRTEDVLDEKIEPARGIVVKNSLGELVGWLDPAAAPGKIDPPRTRWKSVRRFFRGLCCCR
ncbi:uncharacterized protein LOC132947337 [Metopolophium dirhodum]|uniref:uncharacterized protein LOC132947337 n=1 Tax=Metopolophium dirhodum TaxID=44670 RepID=UPI00298F91FA|nr:uncharacterized protein LOC132947337 [Metopolophium dirhodum]